MIKDPEKRKQYFKAYRQRAKEKTDQQVEPRKNLVSIGEELKIESVERPGFYQIIAGERRTPSLVVHSVLRTIGESHEDHRYSDIRASWLPMRPDAPSVFIIAGEQWIDKRFDAADRGALIVLKEVIYGGLSTDTLVRRIFADARLYCFSEIYVPLENPLFVAFYETFRQAKRGHDFPFLNLVEGPYCDNVLAELSLIEDWRKKDLLQIDPSLTVYEQAKGITREKLNPDGTLPASEFYALEALAHLVGGFHADPPPQPPVQHRPSGSPSPFRWMEG